MGGKTRNCSSRHTKVPANRATPSPKHEAKKSSGARLKAWLFTVLTGVVITVIGTVGATIVTSDAVPVPPTNEPPSPTPWVTSSAPRPTHSSGGVHNHGATPFGPPLAVSQTPIDPGGNMVWMFPGKIILSQAQLDHVNALLRAAEFGALYNFFFDLGGYLSSADTYFIVRNNRTYPIWIKNVRIADKSCQAPLTGALVSASEKVNDEPETQLGIDLDSPDISAMRAVGPDIRHWAPEYFSHPIEVMPGETYQFDIRAQASDVACSFRYQAVILDNGRTAIQNLTNQLFRVSAFSQTYLHTGRQQGKHAFPGYEAEYLGGLATPKHDGRLILKYP